MMCLNIGLLDPVVDDLLTGLTTVHSDIWLLAVYRNQTFEPTSMS